MTGNYIRTAGVKASGFCRLRRRCSIQFRAVRETVRAHFDVHSRKGTHLDMSDVTGSQEDDTTPDTSVSSALCFNQLARYLIEVKNSKNDK